MSDSKGLEAAVLPCDNGTAQDAAASQKLGTTNDQKDMYRMGKQQELRRNFRFVSIFGYSMVLMATWETVLTTLAIPLTNGGTGGAIVMFLITALGMGFVIVSMAEMASMAPTSGGQYHWVSEFAPRKHQKFLSYIVGWLCVLGWQTGIASIAFLAGGQIQGLVILNNPDYVPERWHGTLLVIAVATFSILFNTLLARKLPLVEGIVLVLHIFGFFAVFITMWVLGPRSEAKEVFGGFQDNAGWGSVGLSVLVGQLTPIFALLGADAATHMSEELKDASHTLPRAMIATAVVNSTLGFLMLITFCFCLGDVTSVLSTPTGQPHIQVLFNATKSVPGATALASITTVMAVFGCVNNVATCSRQLFAFARDNGVPFSSFFAHVQPGWDIPLNSVIVSFGVAIALSLINIGSTVAFNSIASLGTCALLSSYIISISCMFVKRWNGETLLPCKFSLGRAGIWINGISVVYLSIAFVFVFFPTFPHPTADLMNWNILIYGVVVVFFLVYFFVRGHKVYIGPVEYINKVRSPVSPFLNIHGLTATGKSSILCSYFHLSRAWHVIINVRECITTRHLVERIVASSLDALDEFHDEKTDRRPYARTENLSALCVNMAKILERRGKFVLVLDGMDKLREGGGTLIAALGRLGESIPNLSIILSTTLPLAPSVLHSSSTLFLHFPYYTRTELLTILGAHPPKIFRNPPSLEQFPDYTPDVAAEDDKWLWGRFLQAVYDSLAKHTGRDLVSFKSCAMRIWRPFVEPIISGQFGTRDFSRLMVNRRHLFQLEDSVLDRIISADSVVANATTNDAVTPATPSKKKLANMTAHSLPYFTTHILIAAYLASYNPARTDVTYFMKHTDKRKNKRRAPAISSFSVTGKRSGSKHRKISRHLLTPSPFTLDRLLAIFRALLDGTVPQVADLYTQIATLTSMRLLVRAGGAGSNDALEAGARWRVNFGWEYARALGRTVNLEVGEYLVGGVD